MREGMEIIDGHMHLFTYQLIERIKTKIERRGEAYKSAYKTWHERYTAKYDSELPEENSDPPEKIARDWARELDAHGIDQAFFVAIESEGQDLTSFLNAKRERFYGFATVDPKDPEAPELLKKRVKQEGYVGLKLYPPKEYFLPSDRSLYPLYEEARSLQIPIMFHLGILLSYDADLRFANPIELHPVVRDFPDIDFIIAHFGAGYFREVLFLGYHVQNLYLDTSGKNRWVEYLPFKMELREVFKKALDIFGAEKIIFGTDSRTLSRGYRKSVLEEQLTILQSLNLAREEISLIMGENIRRITRI